MADLVNEIISPEAQKQLDFTSDQLDMLTKQVAELAQAGKAIQFDFKGAKDFAFADDVIKKATASAEQFKDATEQLSKTTIAAAKALELEAKANLSNAKASTEAAKQKEIEIRYTAALTKEKEKLAAQLDNESKAAAKLGNDYEILKKAYTEAANKAKNLGVTVGVNSAAFKEASTEAMKMHQVLLKVETAVGQSQRNVGNYTSALMSMSQVIREAPSFANGLRTGLSAIGNNMPILIDEFKKLSKEVGGSGKALAIMGKSIFQSTNLFVLAFTALQFLQIAMSKTSKSVDEYTDSLKELDKQANKTYTGEQTHAKVLASIAQDTSQSMETRTRAIKELQETYPSYLGNLSKEKMLTGDLTKEMDSLNEALMQRALMRAADSKAQEAANAALAFDLQIPAAEKRLAEAKKEAAKGAEAIAAAEMVAKLNTGERGDKTQMAALAIRYKAEQQAAQDNLNKLLEGKKQALADENNLINIAREAAKKAAPPDGKDGKTGIKDNRAFTGAQELAKAQFDIDKQRLEQSAATNKAISEDAERGLQDRLDAYIRYQSDLQQLAAAEAIMEIKIEDAKIAEQERLAAATTGKTQRDHQLKIDAANIRKQAAEEKFSKIMTGIAEDGQKDVLGIIRTSNEQWIKDEAGYFNDFKVQKLQQYHIQERLLTDALDKGLITRKEYDSKLAKIEADKNITILEAEVAFDRTLLDNKQLTADQELKIREDLAKKEEALANASNGGAKANNPSRGRGRITDPIAKGLLPTDAFKDDAQGLENYLNEFYQGAINLANQAADAIIQAQNRQFDNMIKNLDAEKESITTNAQLKEDAITAELGNTTAAQNEIAKLHAQTAIQQDQIEEKKRKIEAERARFERAAAIASIIQSTAIAIAGALKYGPGAPAIIALIAAAGAAQLASVASSPIPAYKEGTTGHRGGLFIAGDGGEPEFIKAPGKTGYWSASKSTLYSEGKGTTVTPLSKLMGMDATRMGAFSAPDSSAALHSLGKKITDKLDESIEANLWAQRANRTVISKDESLKFELRKARKL